MRSSATLMPQRPFSAGYKPPACANVVSEGYVHPETNACSPVNSLHMHLLVELHGQPGWVAATHWCHSRECHERLPPSPALSRSTAGLKKRLFLYGPAHRAQMLAKAQGGRVLALRKVGAELYLAA
jgi:hypothetical protein